VITKPSYVAKPEDSLPDGATPRRAKHLAAKEVVMDKLAVAPIYAGFRFVPILGRMVPRIVGQVRNKHWGTARTRGENPELVQATTMNTSVTLHRVLQNKLTVARQPKQEVNHTLSPNV
jgi:hypothetical protein